MTAEFPLGDVLSVLHGLQLSRGGYDSTCRLVAFLHGKPEDETLGVRASLEAQEILRQRMPGLYGATIPPRFECDSDPMQWLLNMESIHGRTIPVTQIRAGNHRTKPAPMPEPGLKLGYR